MIIKSISQKIQVQVQDDSQHSSMSKALASIKKAIKQQETPADKIIELDLNGIQIGKFTPEIKSTLELCKNLESLNLSECDISSLKNLPNLKKLNDLDLSTNSIPDSEIKHIGIYKSLIGLSIADNQVQKIETIKQLNTLLPDLQRLECADNKVEQLPNYFKTVFEFFPKLQSLDNKDKEGNDLENLDFEEDQDLEQEDGQEQEKNGNEDSDDDEEVDEDQSYDAEEDDSDESE